MARADARSSTATITSVARWLCALSASLLLALPGGAAAQGNPHDWPMYQRDAARTGYDPVETRINRTSVALLRPKWIVHTGDSVTATPAVVHIVDFDLATPGDQSKKVVYVGSGDGNFYALDAADGSALWTFTADPAPGIGYHMFVSSAYVDHDRGQLYVGGGFTLYALDLRSGAVKWKWTTRDHGGGQIESSPLVLDAGSGNGLVVFGTDLDGRMPGLTKWNPAVLALDADDGTLVWYWRPGWPLDDASPSSCGDVWTSIAADPLEGLLYFGTSDCTRGAQGLYNEAVIALPVAPPAGCADPANPPAGGCLDTSTRERRTEPANWYYQPRLIDPYDADFGSTPLLFDRTTDTGTQKLLGIGGKDGFYYVIERQAATTPDTFRKPQWSKRVVMGGFAGGFIGSTATDGTHIWGATALFDIPTEAQSTFLTPNPFAQPPFLHAFDAASGTIAWQQLGPGPTFGATTAVNGVVFTCSLDQQAMAFDAVTGQVLWASPLLGPCSSAAAVSDGEIFIGGGTKAQGIGIDAANGIHAFTLLADADESELVPPALPPSPWPLGVVRNPLIPEESVPNEGP